MKKGITTHCKEELKLQEPLSIELSTENGEIRFARRKAQSNQTDSVKVAFKKVTVPFLSDSGRILFWPYSPWTPAIRRHLQTS